MLEAPHGYARLSRRQPGNMCSLLTRRYNLGRAEEASGSGRIELGLAVSGGLEDVVVGVAELLIKDGPGVGRVTQDHLDLFFPEDDHGLGIDRSPDDARPSIIHARARDEQPNRLRPRI